MASFDGNIIRQLREHTECSICITTFTDPRVLPCLHTFCLKCLENTASSTNKTPGDEMRCPACRIVFTIPSNGFPGLMRDFKMNSLITMANEANLKSTTITVCDRHKTKPLEVYCLECEQPVCFSCLIDNHQGHKATDIVEVKERFSKELGYYFKRISSYKQQSLHLIKEQDEKKKRYLKEIMENENAILKRSKELIDRIERNTKSLLDELSSLKAQHLTEMEKERDELERHCAIMENYQTYYEATMAKVSLVDICCVKKELPIMVENLYYWFKTRKVSSFEILLQLQDKIEIDLKSEINNIVGRIKATWKDECELKPDMEKKVIIVGAGDGCWSINEMFEFNLSRPNEISKLQLAPTEMQSEAVAVSFDKKLFLMGIGRNYNEIWKFEKISGWTKCANLENGRRGHCATIVDTSIYICGGWNMLAGKVMKSVEAYDLHTNKCSTVGELVYPVWLSACVAYKGLIYIFGGRLDGERETYCEQIFSTRDSTCSLFSKPMPSPQRNLRTLLWNDSVILLNDKACFIFNFETDIWQERDGFKTGVIRFGLGHDEEKVYVFGGTKPDNFNSTDEIKSVLLEDIIKGNTVEWKLHGRLPKPMSICVYA